MHACCCTFGFHGGVSVAQSRVHHASRVIRFFFGFFEISICPAAAWHPAVPLSSTSTVHSPPLATHQPRHVHVNPASRRTLAIPSRRCDMATSDARHQASDDEADDAWIEGASRYRCLVCEAEVDELHDLVRHLCVPRDDVRRRHGARMRPPADRSCRTSDARHELDLRQVFATCCEGLYDRMRVVNYVRQQAAQGNDVQTQQLLPPVRLDACTNAKAMQEEMNEKTRSEWNEEQAKDGRRLTRSAFRWHAS